MPAPLLSLGPFVFQGLEAPEQINSISAQRLVAHQTTAGGQIIDNMGRGSELIRFSGIFTGPEASDRARMLNAIKRAGVPLPLVWSSRIATVVIRQLNITYLSGIFLPYTLTCMPTSIGANDIADLTDPANPISLAEIPSVLAQLGSIGIVPTASQSAAMTALTTQGFDAIPPPVVADVRALLDTTSTTTGTADVAVESNVLISNPSDCASPASLQFLIGALRTSAVSVAAGAEVGAIFANARGRTA